MKIIQQPVFLIDSREQKPFFSSLDVNEKFPGIQIDWDGLKTGDYSIKGMSSPYDHPYSVCVERKSLSDLFGSVGNGRARFEKEYQRMSEFDYAVVIIENDLNTMFKYPPPMSQMLPKSVFRTLLAWSQRYGVHFIPCVNRDFAEKTTYIILMRFFEDRQRGGKMEFCKL